MEMKEAIQRPTLNGKGAIMVSEKDIYEMRQLSRVMTMLEIIDNIDNYNNLRFNKTFVTTTITNMENYIKDKGRVHVCFIDDERGERVVNILYNHFNTEKFNCFIIKDEFASYNFITLEVQENNHE